MNATRADDPVVTVGSASDHPDETGMDRLFVEFPDPSPAEVYLSRLSWWLCHGHGTPPPDPDDSIPVPTQPAQSSDGDVPSTNTSGIE